MFQVSYKFQKIYRKTSMQKSLFNNYNNLIKLLNRYSPNNLSVCSTNHCQLMEINASKNSISIYI